MLSPAGGQEVTTAQRFAKAVTEGEHDTEKSLPGDKKKSAFPHKTFASPIRGREIRW